MKMGFHQENTVRSLVQILCFNFSLKTKEINIISSLGWPERLAKKIVNVMFLRTLVNSLQCHVRCFTSKLDSFLA